MTNTSSVSPKGQNSSIKYEPLEIERRWQEHWQQDCLYRTQRPGNKQKTFYALSMFPYPSGNLHMGHVRNYVITDVIARERRMKGYAVLHPMGWDAFGLPAENAAIERGIDPDTWTNQNIEQMKVQLNRLGLSIDWEREQTTSHSQYYKWTQYIFLELFESGLAYQKSATVNWDPIDKTVLANEQVDAEGRSWRSGAKVEKRELNQWFLKITEYAEELLKDLDLLTGWPERVKTMQENWIGKSVGTEIDFKIKSKPVQSIKVFTTRADTLFGATYLVLAPDHPLVDLIITEENKELVNTFREKVKEISDIERTSEGVPKKGINTGSFAINPANGKEIPIFLGDYVLATYGTGAVMGVPAHDDRDFQFAQKYKLPIIQVIKPLQDQKADIQYQAFTDHGMLINSDEFNNINSQEAKNKITNYGEEKGWASKKTTYKLRDWLISRQRYWGCPIPIIHCEKCGPVPVSKSDLPIKLPQIDQSFAKGKSPMKDDPNWSKTLCPKCGLEAKRETDTMDTFMCSSWYFLRYIDPNNNKQPFDKELIDKWMPVDQYVGGIEHAILHLLYSRFITKALSDRSMSTLKEPFKELLTQGMVQGVTYKNSINSKYIKEKDIKDLNDPKDPITGEKLEVIYEKMSKSKYNGIDPSTVINKYGADTARMFILFKAPPEKDLEWNDSDVEGQYRFLQRVWKLIQDLLVGNQISLFNSNDIRNIDHLNNDNRSLRRCVHKTIKEITDDIEKGKQLNTAISELMKLTNKINELKDKCNVDVISEAISALIKLLSPFAPHLSEELWMLIGGDASVHKESWPLIDEDALKVTNYNLVIQLNGKVRTKVEVDCSLSREAIKQIALDNVVTKKWLDGKEPKKVIIVPGKLVNIVY